MTARKAFSNAVKAYTAKPAQTVGFILIETIVRLFVLCPLLALASAQYPWLALLCPVLFVLVYLPTRQLAAAAMKDALHGDDICGAKLLFSAGYGKALLRGVKQLCIGILWCIPCIAASVYLFWVYSGGMDAFTVLRSVSSLGGGDIIRGAILVGAVYACTFLPALFGMAFHSGRRHESAAGKRLIRGHRGLVLRSWLLGIVTLIPFGIAAAFISADFIKKLLEAMKAFMSTFSLTLPALDGNAWLLLAAVVVLLLPALPLRALISAAAVDDLEDRA